MSDAGTTKYGDFQPKPETLAHLPDASGDVINGHGETEVRRPTPVMWHDAKIIAHGDLQTWFGTQGMAETAIVHRNSNLEFKKKPLPDVADERPDHSAKEWTRLVKEAALAGEADQVAIAAIRPEWIFEGYEAPYKWMVMLTVAMDYDCLKTAPSGKSQTEVQAQYARGTRAAYHLASWMHAQGWEARPHGGPQAGPVLMIPAAIEAGLGELGKHGSMISKKFGSSFRLASVLTNMPLVPDQKDIFGADDFCLNCQVCTRVCPTDAIHTEKQMVRGEEKWLVDFDRCIVYFVENNGCGLCIGQCPWSRTGVAENLAAKMTKRRNQS